MLLRIDPQRSPTWHTLQLPDSDYFRCFPFPWNLYSCLFCSPYHYLTGKLNQQLLATQSEDWLLLHWLLELPWLFFIPLLLQIVHPGLFFTLPSPMDFWWSWILTSKYLLSVFPGFHFPRLHNLPYCLAHPICCLSNPFSAPLPECILLNANQIVFLPWWKPFHPP